MQSPPKISSFRKAFRNKYSKIKEQIPLSRALINSDRSKNESQDQSDISEILKINGKINQEKIPIIHRRANEQISAKKNSFSSASKQNDLKSISKVFLQRMNKRSIKIDEQRQQKKSERFKITHYYNRHQLSSQKIQKQSQLETLYPIQIKQQVLHGFFHKMKKDKARGILTAFESVEQNKFKLRLRSQSKSRRLNLDCSKIIGTQCQAYRPWSRQKYFEQEQWVNFATN